MKTLGKRITSKREAMGLTQDELGKKIGVSRQTICKWENGEAKFIERNRISQLAELFHCSPSWLMGFDDAENVKLTYVAPGKEPIHTKVDGTPIIGTESTSLAALYQACMNVKPENIEVAIKLLKSLS